MRTSFLALLAALTLAACKKDPPPAPPAPPPPPKVPTVVKDDGAVHAVQCQTVIAKWVAGPATDAAPKDAGPATLLFRVGGKVVEFQAAGQLQAGDWSHDIFSPDCGRVALLQDHFGPYHVVKLDGLSAYLEGGGPEAIVEKKGEAEQMAHGDFRWVSNDRIEFTAAAAGGVEAFQVNVASPDKLERTFFAAQAPKGIARTSDGGWELKP